ncbi:HNH endonuclease [Roseinatronobacter sp. NSM]|uniref:HNH endonuclease n=1 Tax=Roseinatronobacter sp. NSM TaxID=3457785 RepID=UPI00403586F0
MKTRPYPSINELLERFEIAPDGTTLLWRKPKTSRFKGVPVGLTITQKGYARIMWGRRPLFLHRVLWKMRAGEDASGFIDHINGDKMDNRQCNLRINEGSGNWRNTKPRGGASKFKGVYVAKCKSKWGSRIKVNKKTIHLGTYENEVDAAKAYDIAAKKYHGAFCSTNEALGLYWSC